MAWNQSDSCEGLTTRQKIAVMQSFCNGKQIEFRSSRVGLANRTQPTILDWRLWTNPLEPQWNWYEFQYRVKEQA